MSRALFLLLAVWSATAFGAVPQFVSYQGYLTDTGGSPLDTVVSMTFTLYDAATTGTQLWTETQPSCTVRAGLFHVVLGSVTAVPDSFHLAQVWLGVTVGSNSEMVPRTRFVSIPYAYRVGTVDGATGGTISGDVTIEGKGNIGSGNSNPGAYTFVVGLDGIASAEYATVAGGRYNRARGAYSFVGGGGSLTLADSNSALNHHTVIGGGGANTASGTYAFVGGGYNNDAIGISTVVGGGESNAASGSQAMVGGGYSNEATGTNATVGGGYNNTASGDYTTVSGGSNNTATTTAATVGGGGGNYAGNDATVGGGVQNTASNLCTAIGGGGNNIASGTYATVAGGGRNRARGSFSFVGGGGGVAAADSNSASGYYSVVLGGVRNVASGQYSLAAGRRAKANHNGAFVWADSYDADFASSATNQFNVRSSGGVRIYTTVDLSVGVTLDAFDNTWNSVCDSTKKTKIARVGGPEVLETIAALPIYRWHMKDGDPTVQHIGPMAQDFWNVFHVGSDSLKISTLDPDGIALAAIQELHKENSELRAKNRELEERLNRLETRFQELTKIESVQPQSMAALDREEAR